MSAPPARPGAPRIVFVFSGHRVDAPGRQPPRFPLWLVPQAQEAIGRALDDARAGPHDLALTQGAAGGDLLFAEACMARGVPLRLLLPLPEPRFLEVSVRASEGHWEARYAALRARLDADPQVIAGPGGNPGEDEAFARCNVALLDAAFGAGSPDVRLICLWDGEPGDGPGGTDHMVGEVRRRGGAVAWIDARELLARSRPSGSPAPTAP
jgi:hypothetical protein